MSSATSVGVSIAAGLILAIIIGSSLVYYSNSTLPTTSTPSATNTASKKSTTSGVSLTWSSTSTTSSPKATNASSDLLLESGLVLELAVNTTKIASGQAVEVSVDLFNPRSASVNLSVSKSWPKNAYLFMPTGDSCGTQNYPIGMGVFQGYYTLANISSASPYYLIRANGSSPVQVSCPLKYNIDYYLFKPMSDSALLGPNDATLAIHGTYALSGYTVVFTDVVPTRTTFHYFQPGPYTLIAATEWGDMILLHFVVL